MYILYVLRSDYYDELQLDEAEEVEIFNMTSLGKLVFMDVHYRHPKQVYSSASSLNPTECLSLAFENLFYMPYDIIENYGHTIQTLDISHNKFGR